MPFMNLGITILFTKPVKQDPNLFSFLSPLSLGVWIYMVTAYLAVSLLLYMLARVSPYEKGHQVRLSCLKLVELAACFQDYQYSKVLPCFKLKLATVLAKNAANCFIIN